VFYPRKLQDLLRQRETLRFPTSVSYGYPAFFFPKTKNPRLIYIFTTYTYSPEVLSPKQYPELCPGLFVLHNIPYYLLSISMSPRGAADRLIPSREGPGASPGVFRFSGGSTAPHPCFSFYTHV